MIKYMCNHQRHDSSICHFCYRSGTVNSKSFVGKVLLRIKWKFELKVRPVIQILTKNFELEISLN